jgi:hypothetical protein
MTPDLSMVPKHALSSRNYSGNEVGFLSSLNITAPTHSGTDAQIDIAMHSVSGTLLASVPH